MGSHSVSIFMAYPYNYHPRRRRSKRKLISNTRFITSMLLMVAVLFLFVYIMVGRTSDHGRSLRENNYNARRRLSCLPCDCDCSSETDKIILSVDLGLGNSSYSDCGKDNPEIKQEMEKSISSLLKEEIDLLTKVSADNLGRTEALTMNAKKTSSHYQKEAEKCNVGMETCEGAREMAEAEFMKERRITKMWQRRAIQLGWKE